MKPLVSILIPCYNAEKWLSETLASALAQTWQNTEIIVVDDGSTDGSLAIAQSFQSPQVKVISQLNQGASAARNRALADAQGDFLQYLDADDLLSPNKIEAQVYLLRQNPPDMLAVCATIHFFDGQSPQTGIYESGLPFLVDSDDPVSWLLKLWGIDGNAGMVHPGAWLTPRPVADRAGNWDEQISLDDDGEYFARVVLNSAGIRRAEREASYYRKYRNHNSLSRASLEKHHYSAFRSMDSKAQHLLAQETSARVRGVLARGYKEIAINSYPKYPEITRIALKRVTELGGTDHVPVMGGKITETIKELFGWRTARLINVYFHFWRSKFKLKSQV